MPSKEAKASSREELLNFYEQQLKEVPAAEAGGAPGGAFLPEKQAAPDPFAVEQRPVLKEAGASILGELGGEKLAAEMGAGRPGRFGLAVMGAGLAAGAVRAAAGEHPLRSVNPFGDGFEEAGKDIWESTSEGAAGAIYGRGAAATARASLAGASNLRYLDADVSPQTKALADDTNKALREYYEKTAGAKVSGERRAWYNPGRYFLGEGTELDRTDVVENLRKAGLDPREARSIAVNGGFALGDLSDRSLYRWMQQLSSKALWTSGRMERFYENRAKMLQGSMTDLGAAFGKPLDPPMLAKAINEGLNGRFNTLEANRRIGSNSLKPLLPDDWSFATNVFNGKLQEGNPADRVLLQGLMGKPWISFDDMQELRSAVGAMAHDPDSPYRDRAKELARIFDRSLQSQLPDNVSRSRFRDWRGADDELNKGQFDKSFVQGLMRNINGREKEVAESMLKGGNVLNYKRLERALGKDSPELMALKAGIVDRITARATDVGEGGANRLNPAFMRRQLQGKGGIGKEYLMAIDPQIAHRYEKYADALDRLNDTARGSSAMAFTIGETQAGGVLGLMYNLTAGNLAQATKLAGMLMTPGYVAKAVLRPDTASLLTRMAGLAQTGQNPKMLSRVAGRLLEKLPYEDVLPGPKPLQLSDIAPPRTGNIVADMMVNPAGVIADPMGTKPGR